MQLRGIIPALHTAFDERGAFDPGRQARLVERLIGQGVHGLFSGGSTGEFSLLSLDERKRLASCVIEAARGRVPVIVHAGAPDTRSAVELAADAPSAGAAAVSCLPPYYYRHRAHEVLRHLEEVAAACSPLPFYYYHIPETTGVALDEELLAGLLSIPRFAGLKWSDGDLFALGRTAEALGDRADVLAGRDELLFQSLSVGARGAIGSTYNFLAPWFVALWRSYGEGRLEEAREIQARAARTIGIVHSGDRGLSFGKEATRLAAADCGEPRAPLRRLTDGEKLELRAALEDAGVELFR